MPHMSLIAETIFTITVLPTDGFVDLRTYHRGLSDSAGHWPLMGKNTITYFNACFSIDDEEERRGECTAAEEVRGHSWLCLLSVSVQLTLIADYMILL